MISLVSRVHSVARHHYYSYFLRALFSQFSFFSNGQRLRYFSHPYNFTWLNERAIEIPLARRFLAEQSGRGLEVGNVLRHYQPMTHTVIDKYERAECVLNVDVLDYKPFNPFAYIVALSTLEHVGWDETPRDPDKAVRALRHLQSLLDQDGRMFVTCPLGYNPGLDDAIISGLCPVSQAFFTRRARVVGWREVAVPSDDDFTYPHASQGATAIWVAEFTVLGAQ